MKISIDETYQRRNQEGNASKYARVTEVLPGGVRYELTTVDGERYGTGFLSKQLFALTFGPVKTAPAVRA